MYDMYPEWGPAKHDPESPTQRRRPCRPRSTCETTAASAPTTTSVRPHAASDAVPTAPSSSPSSRVTGSAPRSPPRRSRCSSGATARRGVKFEPTRYDLGAERYLATGEVLPDSVLAEIRQHDAILLGAVGGKPGDPNLPAGHPRARAAAAAALRARPLRQPAPVADLPGRRLAAGRPRARSTSSSSARAPRAPTPATAARCASARRTRSPPRSASTRRSASSASCATRSRRAQKRPRKKLTLVHKTNVLVHAGARLVADRRRGRRRSSPTSTVDYLHVDAATIFLTTDPARFDVIVTDNLFGDIITDLAAADHRRHRAGGERQRQPRPHRAVACSSRCTARRPTSPASRRPTRPRRSCPSALLLDHLGLDDAARAVEDAVVADLAARDARRTPSHLRGRRRDRRPSSRLTAAGPSPDPRTAARLARR